MKWNERNSIQIIHGGLRWERQLKARLDNTLCLEQYGYKVYSQNDEDGIIQEIFNRIGTTNKKFVEFGVQNGLESNCHYLLHKGWSGLFIEGDEKSCDEIKVKFKPVIHDGKLHLIHAFINRDNINGLIGSVYTGDIDLLSIDIDGNDYHIWKAIDVIRPRVVIIEYNGKFSPDVEWIMGYYEHHIWRGSDWHGASLKSLEILGRDKGYQLVGTNLNGSNAFFVRCDLARDRFYEPATAEELFNPLNTCLIHTAGHISKYCLANQKEGLGIFNYIDKDILPLSARKLWDGRVEYCFTCRNIPMGGQIEIPVKYGEGIQISAYVNDKELETAYCKETRIVKIDMVCLEQKQTVIKINVILYAKENKNAKLLCEDAKVIYSQK